MHAIQRTAIVLIVATAAIVATGCGLKDDLYLPVEDVEAGADTSAAGADAGADSEEDPAPADPTREAE